AAICATNCFSLLCMTSPRVARPARRVSSTCRWPPITRPSGRRMRWARFWTIWRGRNRPTFRLPLARDLLGSAASYEPLAFRPVPAVSGHGGRGPAEVAAERRLQVGAAHRGGHADAGLPDAVELRTIRRRHR